MSLEHARNELAMAKTDLDNTLAANRAKRAIDIPKHIGRGHGLNRDVETGVERDRMFDVSLGKDATFIGASESFMNSGIIELSLSKYTDIQGSLMVSKDELRDFIAKMTAEFNL